jgi:elongation factor 1-beta
LPNNSYSASQADVAVYKALKSAPEAAKYPHAARWYKHIATYEDEFATLSGDASKPYTAYGPEVAEVTLNPAKAPEKEEAGDDDDVDLFGSDDEEEDAEAARIREERLAEYRKKKEAKGPKPAAKSIVTLDVKPWGKTQVPFRGSLLHEEYNLCLIYDANESLQTTRPT